MKKPSLGRVAIYAVLLLGAVVFSFPFVNMASTSVKVDRELYTDEFRVLPQEPRPRVRSPYYEERRLSALPGSAARRAEAMGRIEALVKARLPGLPGEAVGPVAEAAWTSLAARAPAAVWEGELAGKGGLMAFAERDLSVARLTEAAAGLRREWLLGSVRARSEALVDSELLKDIRPAARWGNGNPQAVTLEDGNDGLVRYARVGYDLSNTAAATLTVTAPLPFPAGEFQRVQLRMRPDDTWHNVGVEVWVGGKIYEAERKAVLAGVEWTTLTFQFPSADDTSTKIKTWTLLRDTGRTYAPPATAATSSPPAAAATGGSPSAGDIRLVLTLERVNAVEAGYNKAALNYRRVLDHIPFWRYVRVSLFLVIANIALTLLFSSLAAYAFARLTWPGREFCFVLMLATMMIPGQVTMIPHFLIWKGLGAYNTLSPLYLGAIFGNAFFIFLLRQFMRGIPRDLEDAARIDGCGFLRIYWHVILPLIKPSLAAIAIFTFIGSWNNFMGPLLYISDQRLYPLAFGLYAFSVQVQNNPALTMAASLLMTVPVVVLFFAAQKYFIQGVTLTGMKG